MSHISEDQSYQDDNSKRRYWIGSIAFMVLLMVWEVIARFSDGAGDRLSLRVRLTQTGVSMHRG